jgi:glycosyltransferase involved in cell wall biosynthesis
MNVSVIMTVWNGAPYLREAIGSVLAQTLPPIELIVVDDGSTDETPAILASFGDAIRAHRQPNAGQGAATMAGIAMSRGSMLAFNDHDDVWPMQRNQQLVKALDDDLSLDAAFGHCEQFVSPELDDDAKRRLAPPYSVLAGEAMGCMTIHRSAFDRIGGFNAEYLSSHFVDWLARAKSAGIKTTMLDAIVLRRRLHENNFGRRQSESRDRFHLKALRQHILRSRGDGQG